jgi:hypothetical protein
MRLVIVSFSSYYDRKRIFFKMIQSLNYTKPPQRFTKNNKTVHYSGRRGNGIDIRNDLIPTPTQSTINHVSPISYRLCTSDRADSFITSTTIGSYVVWLIRNKYIRIISFLSCSSWSSVIGFGLICLTFMDTPPCCLF